MSAKPTQNMEDAEKAYWLTEEMAWVKNETTFRSNTDDVALERANHLVTMHSKVRSLTGGTKYKVVEPILPMDVLGVYILLPEIL
jgi:hypothetical protein